MNKPFYSVVAHRYPIFPKGYDTGIVVRDNISNLEEAEKIADGILKKLNAPDVEFCKAHDIPLEDPDPFDEVLYHVNIVIRWATIVGLDKRTKE